MRIRNRTTFVSTHKMWSLNPNMSPQDINDKLQGKVEDQSRSCDGKCTHSWDFTVDGKPCGIWDYKGSKWSGYGPMEVFQALGMDPTGGW